jgi:TENA/THI-4/PQQC family
MSVAEDLVRRAREENPPGGNRFLDLLEISAVPRERLTWLAGEQWHILRSDRRSFALFAARFPESPAGDLFLELAAGEGVALGLLVAFAAALGRSEDDLRTYEPSPRAQAYPAYLAWSALSGTRSGAALAMLANLQEWGAYCGRTAGALTARYGLDEDAVAFFRFFAEPPLGFAEQAVAVIEHGLAAGEDPREALRAARMLHAYEAEFWAALAEGL